MNFSSDNDTHSHTVMDHGSSYAHEVMNTAKKMHFVTSGICAPILMVIGIIGNLLSIKLWRKKSLWCSTGMYLIAQAVNDTGVLVMFFLTDSLTMIDLELKTKYSYGVFYSFIGYPIFYFFVVNSIWTLVGVTVDRYLMVCWIMEAKALCTDKAAKRGVALISFLCFVLNTPHFKTYYPVLHDELAPGKPAFDFTEFGQSTGSQMYEFWVHCMFIVLVPWIAIFVMNMAILRRVMQVNKEMTVCRGEQAQDKAARKENQLTKLLLTVTFTFLLLIALQCIVQCFFMMQPEISDKRIVSEAYAVAKLGIILNSSINFFLYCVSGKRFRKECRLYLHRVFGCRFMVLLPDTSELYTTRDQDASMASQDSQPTTLSMGLQQIDTPE